MAKLQRVWFISRTVPESFVQKVRADIYLKLVIKLMCIELDFLNINSNQSTGIAIMIMYSSLQYSRALKFQILLIICR